MSDQIVAPRTRNLAELAEQLTRWLGARMPQATDVALSGLDYPRGAGRSHETILFDLSWTEGGQRRQRGLVLRVKPSANEIYPDDLFEEQYRVMRVLHERGVVPVAETLWFEEDADVLGAPFFVMEKLTGRVAVSYPSYAQSGWVADATPAQRRRMWESGVRNLAAIQKLPVEAATFLAGPAHAPSGLEQEWDKFDRFVEWISAERRWPVLDAARDQLRRRWPANRPEGIVWGDARLGNMMFDENFDVLAVMDWEQASLGGALNDLAWWVHSAEQHAANGDLSGMGDRDETVALWREVTGIPTGDLDWYLDFTAFKMSCLSVSTARVWGIPEPDHAHLAQRLGIVI